MFSLNTPLAYPLLVILSIGKRSIEQLGSVIHKSGDTIARLLQPSKDSLAFTQILAQKSLPKTRNSFFLWMIA